MPGRPENSVAHMGRQGASETKQISITYDDSAILSMMAKVSRS